MRLLLSILIVVLQFCLSRASGADPVTPPIRFTDLTVPVPLPAPAPDPATVVQALAPDTIFAIDSDVDVQVEAFPAGLVNVTTETGPVKIRGKFADSPGITATKTFKGKSVITVEAIAGASGRVTVAVVPAAAKSPADWIRRTFDVGAGQGPRPPPPGPQPAPAPPAPGAKLFAVVVADRTNIDPAQAAALASPAFRTYLAFGGHELDQLDTRTSDPNEKSKLALFQPFAAKVTGPALVLVDAAGPTKGLVRSVVALPTTGDALVGAFKAVVGP